MGLDQSLCLGFAMIRRCVTFSYSSLIWSSPWFVLRGRVDSVPSSPERFCSDISCSSSTVAECVRPTFAVLRKFFR